MQNLAWFFWCFSSVICQNVKMSVTKLLFVKSYFSINNTNQLYWGLLTMTTRHYTVETQTKDPRSHHEPAANEHLQHWNQRLYWYNLHIRAMTADVDVFYLLSCAVKFPQSNVLQTARPERNPTAASRHNVQSPNTFSHHWCMMSDQRWILMFN